MSLLGYAMMNLHAGWKLLEEIGHRQCAETLEGVGKLAGEFVKPMQKGVVGMGGRSSMSANELELRRGRG